MKTTKGLSAGGIPLAASLAASLAAASLGETPREGADVNRIMTLCVDATDIERGLVHSVMQIPVQPGGVDPYYVEWTPGNHNPSGPIQNVVDFFVKDSSGNRIDWRRDPTHVVRVSFEAPKNSPTVSVELTYIANQPGVNSRSSDTYARPNFGGINWNTVLVYPGGVDKDEFLIEASLKLPPGWKCATALPARSPDAQGESSGPLARFEPVTLARLVDSPVILGSTLASYTIPTPDRAPHYFHGVGRKSELTRLPEKRVDRFGVMVEQAEKIFGRFPRSQYHFLILLGDDLPGFGLEHCDSTFISMADRDFVRAEGDEADPMTVVPHEYIHAWNGKLRAPKGLLHENYHTPSLTQLIWVYEGMTTYYTDVLAARCGLITPEDFRSRLVGRLVSYEQMTGRRWRSVEDTGSALRFLRERSLAWEDLRRRQDYYSEAALFWMECDAIIRSGTQNKKSLDDFCLAFFDVAPGAVGRPKEYDRADVVAGLRAAYAGQDWDALIRARIETPQQSQQFELPARLGWRLDYSDEPTAGQKGAESSSKDANLRTSIGLSVGKDGQITSIVPDSAADRARLAYTMKIVAVDGDAYSAERLRDAVRQSRTTGAIDLLVNVDGERMQTFTLKYDSGPRYPTFVREPEHQDVIEDIVRPRSD